MNIDSSNITDLRLLLNNKEEQNDHQIICSITDRKGTILYANEKFCQISGYLKEELIGANHNIVNSGLHNKDFFKQLWQTVSKGNIWQGEIRNKSKDGNFYWVDTIIFPVFDQQHATQKYFSVRTVINEKKWAEQNREKNIGELQTLLFKISHGIRQPVTQIMGILELLNQHSISLNEMKELINYIHLSTTMLDNYTRELTQHVDFITKQEFSININK